MTAAEWNDRYPIGTTVSYAPVNNVPNSRTTRQTDSEAWETIFGHAVVRLRGGALPIVPISTLTPVEIQR